MNYDDYDQGQFGYGAPEIGGDDKDDELNNLSDAFDEDDDPKSNTNDAQDGLPDVDNQGLDDASGDLAR